MNPALRRSSTVGNRTDTKRVPPRRRTISDPTRDTVDKGHLPANEGEGRPRRQRPEQDDPAGTDGGASAKGYWWPIGTGSGAQLWPLTGAFGSAGW